MRGRALLAAAVGAVTLLAGVLPAGAHDGPGRGGHDDAEGSSGPLEVAARPAVARVANPVQVRAEYEADDLEVDDETEDAVDDETEDAVDDETEDEADDSIETQSKRHGDDDGDGADDETESEDQDEADVEDGADDADGAPAVTTVAFTVDFGDGSAAEAMDVRGDHRRSGKAKAHATHAYDAEGDYVVTVTATPEGGDAVEATVTVHVGRGSARMEGDDRIATALRISRDSFDDGSAGAVLLARADGFADALASATLALAEEAPVLLVPSGDLPDEVLTEIDRLLGGTGRVYLLGGEAAITPAVADELTALGDEVIRIAGDDRIATSVAIAQFLVDAGAVIDEVVLASAVSFPDALSGAAYAAEEGAPVLLTAPDALSPAVRDLLTTLGTDTAVTVVGGTAGISDGVVEELTTLGFTVERLAGEDRYGTSVEIADHGHEQPTVVVIATGRTFPDALAGGAYAGRLDAPLLLVGDDLPDDVADYLRDHADTIDIVVVLGGGGAVTDDVVGAVQAALGL